MNFLFCFIAVLIFLLAFHSDLERLLMSCVLSLPFCFPGRCSWLPSSMFEIRTLLKHLMTLFPGIVFHPFKTWLQSGRIDGLLVFIPSIKGWFSSAIYCLYSPQTLSLRALFSLFSELPRRCSRRTPPSTFGEHCLQGDHESYQVREPMGNGTLPQSSVLQLSLPSVLASMTFYGHGQGGCLETCPWKLASHLK